MCVGEGTNYFELISQFNAISIFIHCIIDELHNSKHILIQNVFFLLQSGWCCLIWISMNYAYSDIRPCVLTNIKPVSWEKGHFYGHLFEGDFDKFCVVIWKIWSYFFSLNFFKCFNFTFLVCKESLRVLIYM